MNPQNEREIAEERVDKKIGFFIHLIVYIGVNSLLAFLNLTREHESLWFLWVLGGWGLGLLFHGLVVFVFQGDHASLKERLIQREMKSQHE